MSAENDTPYICVSMDLELDARYVYGGLYMYIRSDLCVSPARRMIVHRNTRESELASDYISWREGRCMHMSAAGQPHGATAHACSKHVSRTAACMPPTALHQIV